MSDKKCIPPAAPGNSVDSPRAVDVASHDEHPAPFADGAVPYDIYGESYDGHVESLSGESTPREWVVR